MSKGLSPKLPLQKDPADGYALNKDYISLVKQNLKMLLLTAPGERIMLPEFGVGLRNYLFENSTQATYGRIESKIRTQVKKYMPFVEVRSVNFAEQQGQNLSSAASINLQVNFVIIPLDLFQSLEMQVATN